MNFLWQVVIFLLIVFLYLHIQFQLKVSNDLEVYEIVYENPANLQKICDMRLPALFTAPAEYKPPRVAAVATPAEIQIYNTNDNETDGAISPPVALAYGAAMDLLQKDGASASALYTQKNGDFLTDTDVADSYQENDSLWKPPLTVSTKYDLWAGGKNAHTPLAYHTDFRRFICGGGASAAPLMVKLAPWKNHKYLSPRVDWANFDFYSMENPWAEAAAATTVVEYMEIFVPANGVLYIPPYWWYSVKFLGNDDTAASIAHIYSYRTIFNVAAIAPKLAMQMIYQISGAAAATAPPAAAKPPAAAAVVPVAED